MRPDDSFGAGPEATELDRLVKAVVFPSLECWEETTGMNACGLILQLKPDSIVRSSDKTIAFFVDGCHLCGGLVAALPL